MNNVKTTDITTLLPSPKPAGRESQERASQRGKGVEEKIGEERCEGRNKETKSQKTQVKTDFRGKPERTQNIFCQDKPSKHAVCTRAINQSADVFSMRGLAPSTSVAQCTPQEGVRPQEGEGETGRGPLGF